MQQSTHDNKQQKTVNSKKAPRLGKKNNNMDECPYQSQNPK